MPPLSPPALRLIGWAIHAYTASGLILALLAVEALVRGDAPRFFLLNVAAVVIDGTDGTLARRFEVKRHVPEFDGARLDDIVDFLTWALLPALALPMLGLLSPPWSWAIALPVLASGYGFCQQRAKTDDAFVGFPSYWNILVLYLYVFQPPAWVTVTLLALLSVMVFVPIHYVYPTRTRLLRPLTIGLSLVYTAACAALALRPDAPWAPPLAGASLLFVAYYTVLSFVHHAQVMAKHRAAGQG